jgi:hypothetical protein
MPSIDKDVVTSKGVPDVYCAIEAARGNPRIFRRPGHSEDAVLLTIHVDVLPAECLPDLYGTITVISS